MAELALKTITHLIMSCNVTPDERIVIYLILYFQIYWVGPILGGILGGFTFEYMNKSSTDLQNFQSGLRQHVYSLQRKEDGTSSNSIATELACDQETTEELQI